MRYGHLGHGFSWLVRNFANNNILYITRLVGVDLSLKAATRNSEESQADHYRE